MTRQEIIENYSNIYCWLKYRNKLYLLHKYIKAKNFGKEKIWTKEKCLIEQKKYKNRNEWQKNSPSSYASAIKNGYVKIIHDSSRKWNKKTITYEAKKYKTLTEWHNFSKGSYDAAKRLNIMNECKKLFDSWSPCFKDCFNDALNYKYKKDWQAANNIFYKTAKKNSWIIKCTRHMQIPSKEKIYYKKKGI